MLKDVSGRIPLGPEGPGFLRAGQTIAGRTSKAFTDAQVPVAVSYVAGGVRKSIRYVDGTFYRTAIDPFTHRSSISVDGVFYEACDPPMLYVDLLPDATPVARMVTDIQGNMHRMAFLGVHEFDAVPDFARHVIHLKAVSTDPPVEKAIVLLPGVVPDNADRIALGEVAMRLSRWYKDLKRSIEFSDMSLRVSETGYPDPASCDEAYDLIREECDALRDGTSNLSAGAACAIWVYVGNLEARAFSKVRTVTPTP